MLMQVEITQRQFLLYVIAAGAVLGFLIGLAVLILGMRKGNRKLGIIGLVCTTLAGGIGSLLLAAIVAGVFIWLILKKPAAVDNSSAETFGSANHDAKVSDDSDAL